MEFLEFAGGCSSTGQVPGKRQSSGSEMVDNPPIFTSSIETPKASYAPFHLLLNTHSPV